MFHKILTSPHLQTIQPKISTDRLVALIIGPKLDVEPIDNFIVQQNCAAISSKALRTGGLATCTALVLTTATSNFMVHIDSLTKLDWLVDQIKKFQQSGEVITGVLRFNAHGRGLNSFAALTSKAALEQLGLFDRCVDDNGVSGFHTVFARAPGNLGGKPRVEAKLVRTGEG